MPATAGRKARVKISTTAGGAGTYTAMAGIQSFNHEINGNNIDDSEMGVDYMGRIQGLKDGRLTVDFSFKIPSDTTGQQAIRDALLNDTEIWYQALPDNGVTAGLGFKQQCKVAAFRMSAAVNDKVSGTAELEGTGVITTV